MNTDLTIDGLLLELNDCTERKPYRADGYPLNWVELTRMLKKLNADGRVEAKFYASGLMASASITGAGREYIHALGRHWADGHALVKVEVNGNAEVTTATIEIRVRVLVDGWTDFAEALLDRRDADYLLPLTTNRGSPYIAIRYPPGEPQVDIEANARAHGWAVRELLHRVRKTRSRMVLETFETRERALKDAEGAVSALMVTTKSTTDAIKKGADSANALAELYRNLKVAGPSIYALAKAFGMNN